MVAITLDAAPTECEIPVDTLPLIIIVSAVVVIGLIWAALRVTIKRDRATIKSDMEAPEDLKGYHEDWRKES